MSLPVVVTNKQIEVSRAWVRSFFECTDGFGPANEWVDRFLQPDAVINIGNSPPRKGRKVIIEEVEKDHASLSAVKTDSPHIDVLSDRIYVQQEISLVVRNDPEQKKTILKAVVVIWKKVNEEKASGMDVYVDQTPLVEVIKKYSK